MNLIKKCHSVFRKLIHPEPFTIIYLLLLPQIVYAESVLDRVLRTGTMQVCIWPDYFSITYRDPLTNNLSGLDIDMAEAFARELRVRARFIDSTFQTFAKDLDSDRCDIAMFAIAIDEKRKKLVLFSSAHLKSDIYVVVHRGSNAIHSWGDIDRPGVRVGVQAGTFLEQAMSEKYKHAEVVSIDAPQSRERELRSGRIDALLTNLTFSRRISNSSDWARILSPPKDYLISPYGYAVKLNEQTWIEQVNKFLSHVKSTGQLRESARRHGIEAMLIP